MGAMRVKRITNETLDRMLPLAHHNAYSHAAHSFGEKLSIDKAISQFFFSRYALVVAKTDKEKEISFRTRHHVYCEEMQFEKTNSEQQEVDQYDEFSVNCYIKHLPTGKCAGTIRLVLPNNAEQSLPLDKFLPDEHEVKSATSCNRKVRTICEISRLAIPKAFRLRQLKSNIVAPEKLVGSPYSASDFNLNHFPYLSIALYFMIASIGIKENVKHAYVLMEPKLARRLKMFGIHFEQVGEPINHNGVRAPYRIAPGVLINNLIAPLKDFQESVDNAIKPMLNNIRSECDGSVDEARKRRVANAA